MSESISQQLKNLRESKSLSLEQVSQATRIRLHYLVAIEEGNFSALSSPAQSRGFVRSYAAYLGLEPQAVMSALAAELPGNLSVDSRPAPLVEPTVTEIDYEEAEKIFQELGAKLKIQRELLGLTLQDVELHTHIRSHYLIALEAGCFKDLPSPVQGRGMLNNYASFLGIDAEPILLRYAEALQARLNAQQASGPRRRSPFIRRNWSEKPLLQRLFSPDLLLGGLVVIFLASFTIWGGLRISDLRTANASLTATQTASVLSVQPAGGTITSVTPTNDGAPSLTGTPSNEIDENSEFVLPQNLMETEEGSGNDDPEAASPAAGSPSSTAAVQVYVVVKQRTWLRVLVDDKVEFEGRVAPGGAYQFDGEKKVELLTGNGAGLQVFYNQADLGLLGMYGEVVNRIFSVEGILTPTPTLTPTGRPAPTSTSTPEGMETETPTPTPASTATPSSPVVPGP